MLVVVLAYSGHKEALVSPGEWVGCAKLQAKRWVLGQAGGCPVL